MAGRGRLRSLTGGEAEDLLLRWDRFRTAMLGYVREYDAVVCPVDHTPAIRHEEPDDDRFTYTLPFSLSGWPCAVVRAGTSPEGLPIGVQIVAQPWREDVTIAAARQIETLTGGWRLPPL